MQIPESFNVTGTIFTQCVIHSLQNLSFHCGRCLYVLGSETPVTTEFFPSSRLALESNSVVAPTILEQGVLKLHQSRGGCLPTPVLNAGSSSSLYDSGNLYITAKLKATTGQRPYFMETHTSLL